MTSQRIKLSIAREFTKIPGPRYRRDGDFSGQEFFEDLLLPRFREAIDTDLILEVNLDGVAGYPTSFLEEAFGGLGRTFDQGLVDSKLAIVCNDEPYQNEEIRRYIREARTPR